MTVFKQGDWVWYSPRSNSLRHAGQVMGYENGNPYVRLANGQYFGFYESALRKMTEREVAIEQAKLALNLQR